MAIKSIILITLLVVFVAPQTNAQSLITINGTLFCSLTGAPLINATIPALPFPNATVQVTILGIPIGATVQTNSLGQFTLNLVQSLLTSITNILSLANVVVTTPLTACNSTLPANTFLQSVRPLQLLSNNAPTGNITLTVSAFVPIRI